MKIVDLRGELPVHPYKRYERRKIEDLKSVAIHHSLTDNLPGDNDVYAFARYHVRDHQWPGIAYTYVIDKDGTVYKCWGVKVVSYHVGQYNKESLGICMVGDFRDYDPSDDQFDALFELLEEVIEAYNLGPNSIKGHSELDGYGWKKCPVIDMDYIRSYLRGGVEDFFEGGDSYYVEESNESRY